MCGGFLGIPEAINMLDNERTRWVKLKKFLKILKKFLENTENFR